MTTLAPCSHCGSEVHLHENDWCEPSEWSVHCFKCRASVTGFRMKKSAIAAWNRRHVSPAALEAARRILSGKDENGRQNVDYGPSAEAVARELLRIGGSP